MFSRYRIYSQRSRIIIPALVLCLCALAATPKASHSAGQNGLQCLLTAPTARFVSGQMISIDVTIRNTSSKTVHIPWTTGGRHLLEWGALSVSIRDEKGNRYKYVPMPGPFLPRQKSHYQGLTAGNKVSYNLNVCMFRDKKYSHSPCSRPGEYTVSVTYSNYSADYLDAGTNKTMELNAVWTGKTMCTEVNIVVVGKE